MQKEITNHLKDLLDSTTTAPSALVGVPACRTAGGNAPKGRSATSPRCRPPRTGHQNGAAQRLQNGSELWGFSMKAMFEDRCLVQPGFVIFRGSGILKGQRAHCLCFLWLSQGKTPYCPRLANNPSHHQEKKRTQHLRTTLTTASPKNLTKNIQNPTKPVSFKLFLPFGPSPSPAAHRHPPLGRRRQGRRQLGRAGAQLGKAQLLALSASGRLGSGEKKWQKGKTTLLILFSWVETCCFFLGVVLFYGKGYINS